MGFRTFSVLDATKSLRRFFTVLDLFLGIFGSLALAVATLAIINTLVMAVLERRREIGVMKAIGASDQRRQEAVLHRGGRDGLLWRHCWASALGFAIGKAINIGTGIYLQRHQLPAEAVWIMPPWLIGAAIAFSIVVSLLAGLVSGKPRGETRSGADAEVRMTQTIPGRISFTALFALRFACSRWRWLRRSMREGRAECSVVKSAILARPVRYCAYLPASFDTDKTRRYPVLYYLHGLGDNEQSLLNLGGWDLIEDMRRQGKIGDFVVLAPNGGHTFFLNSADGKTALRGLPDQRIHAADGEEVSGRRRACDARHHRCIHGWIWRAASRIQVSAAVRRSQRADAGVCWRRFPRTSPPEDRVRRAP